MQARRYWMTHVTLALMLAFASPAQSAATPSAAVESQDVPTAVDDHARMTVPVLVNGHGPFPFVVDTGADRTVISRELSQRLGLPEGPAVLMHDTAGISRVTTAKIASLEIGRREINDINAPTIAETSLRAAGMLGIDSLHDQRVLIDFARQQITISPAEDEPNPDPGAILVRAKRRFGQLILVDAEAKGIRLNVILDSGAQSSIGNEPLRRLLARQGHAAKPIPTEVISVTGRSTPAEFIPISEVKLGGVTIRNVPIAFANLHTFRQFGLSRKPAMLLGMDVLRHFERVSVDFKRKKVRLLLPRDRTGRE